MTLMKKILLSLFLCASAAIGYAQETKTTADTITTKAITPTTTPVTGAQRNDAVNRRSASEVNAEIESKQNNQTRAQQKPDPYQKPLTEPATTTTGGSATIKK